MGVCLSTDDDHGKAQSRNEAIDRQLAHWAKQEQHVIKVLLLGAGESGKSTLVKQMKIIHHNGFTHQELMSFKPPVLDNLLASMKYVLSNMGLMRINLQHSSNKSHASLVLSSEYCTDSKGDMLVQIYGALKALWEDAGVRRAVSRGYEFELNDSAIYFFENMDRICAHKYLPSSKDVLRVRIRTSSVIETCFHVSGIVIRMFDVGGQRSQRRKWIQCFDDVNAVLFVAALSAYDMTLFEEPNVSRLEESIHLFKSICNNRYFRGACMVLFLNKLDLFRDKILYSHRHLSYFLPDYAGPKCDVNHAASYIQHLFVMQSQQKYAKSVYTHLTTATETSNVEVVFDSVMDSIIRGNLSTTGLL